MKLKFIILLILICPMAFSQLKYIDKVYSGQGGIEGLNAINNMALSPDGKFMYVVGDKKHIAILKVDSLSDDLSMVDFISDGDPGMQYLNGIYELDFSPDGRFVYGIVMDSNALVTFARDTITGLLSPIQVVHNNQADSALTAGCAITVSKDGKFMYTASIRANTIGIFQRDQNNGMVTFIDTVSTHLLGNPQILWYYGYFLLSSNDSKNIYIGSYSDNAMVVYQRNGSTGALTFIQKLENVTDIPDFSLPKSMILSKDDRFLYTFNKYGINTLQRNTTDGSLTPHSYYQLSGFPATINPDLWPCSGDISEDGKSLVIAANYDDVVFRFDLDSATGAISPDTVIHNDNNYVYSSDNHTSHRMIRISKDNHTCYVASYFENKIALIDLDTTSPGLSPRKEIINGQGGMDYFNEPTSIVLTGNENFAFISSRSDNAIITFSRNKTTGTLKKVDSVFAVENNQNGSDGLTRLALSKDNKNLYACTRNGGGSTANAVYAFSVDSSTGQLDTLQHVNNGDVDVYGTLYFVDIAVSADDQYVYALSEEDILKIYSRNLSTGMLTFLKDIAIHPIDIATYFNANRILISKDNKYLYLTSNYAIKVFQRNTTNGDLSLLQNVNCTDNTHTVTMYAYDADLTEDQKSLFLLNSGTPHLIEYKVDSAGGQLSFVDSYLDNTTLSTPRSMCISSDKKYICFGEDNLGIDIVRLNPENEKYEFIKTIYGSPIINGGLKTIDALKITSDNRSVYAISNKDKSVTNYRPVLFLGNDISACNGDIITIGAQADERSYLWSTGDTTASINIETSGSYNLTVTNLFGEPETDSIQTVFHPLPVPDLGPDTAQCPDITLKCSREYVGYQWNTGDTTRQLIVNTSGNYSVEVTDSNGCRNNDSINVTVYPLPALELGNDIQTCSDSYTIIPLTDTAVTYLWSDGSHGDSLMISKSGEYSLIVTNNFGCEQKDSVNIALKPSIELPSDTTMSINDTLVLMPGQFDFYLWTIGNNNFSQPTLSVNGSYFSNNDTITVYLMVQNNNCQASDSVLVIASDYTGIHSNFVRSISIYPNPVTDKLFLDLGNMRTDNLILKLYSVKGNLYKTIIPDENKIEIDMSNYPKGIYLLKFAGESINKTVKILKN